MTNKMEIFLMCVYDLQIKTRWKTHIMDHRQNMVFYSNILVKMNSACTTSAYHYTDPVPQNFLGQRTR